MPTETSTRPIKQFNHLNNLNHETDGKIQSLDIGNKKNIHSTITISPSIRINTENINKQFVINQNVSTKHSNDYLVGKERHGHLSSKDKPEKNSFTCNLSNMQNTNAKKTNEIEKDEYANEVSLIHNRKHVKLKDSNESFVKNASTKHNNYLARSHTNISCGDDNESAEQLVTDCSMNLCKRPKILNNFFKMTESTTYTEINKLLLQDSNKELPVSLLRNNVAKSMRSSPKNGFYIPVFEKEHEQTSSDCMFLCKWKMCGRRFCSSQKLIKHVKVEHIYQPYSNDIYICQWDSCKFYNRPSCSHKWLTKHVLRHCELKPFKCVIFGCDASFPTQSGLARHVPTHFNEGKVQRTCVQNNTEICGDRSKRNWKCSFDSCSVKDADHGEVKVASKTNNQDSHDIGSKSGYNQKILLTIKRKLQQTTCTSLKGSGFINKSLQLEHQVYGKRTTAQSEDLLLSPLLFSERLFWVEEKEYRKRKAPNVEVPVCKLNDCYKNDLFPFHCVSSRNRKARK